MSFEFKQSSITSGTFRSVCCDSTGKYLAACEEGGNVYTSSDYGANWVVRTLGSNSNQWQSICMNSLGDKLYVTGKVNLSGQYTQIWESNDYGVTWSKQIGGFSFNVNFTSICCNSTGINVAACVSGGSILVSTNGGGNFNNRAQSRSWKSVCINAVGNRLAAVEGNIWTSSDSGTTWLQKTTTVRTWSSICSNSLGDRLAATVQNGNIWISTDYGEIWTEKVIETGNITWTSVCSNGTGQILAASHDTVGVGFTRYSIYISSDYGDTWTQKVLPSASYIALTSVCLSKPGDNISACMFNGSGILYGFSTSTFLYKNLPLHYCLSPPNASDTYNLTLTNYNAFGTTFKYLKQFYLGLANEATFDNEPKMYATVGYNNNGNINKFCPVYVFYPGNRNTAAIYTAGTTATYSVTPPPGVTNMLVILVGGGGGGGGGQSNSGEGDGGGGGGSGGISVYYLTAAAYTLSIGYGGIYGYSYNNSAGGPGSVRTFSPNTNGVGAGDATGSSITVSGITYSVNGGLRGGGGLTGGGAAGVGATAVSTNALYSYSGVNGVIGGTSYNGAPGGNGGVPQYGSIINESIISMTSLQTQLVATNVNPIRQLYYGEGGKGGRGDLDIGTDYGANGEYGAPGCAIVFYYFN